MAWLFSYGSNNLEQLGERLGHSLTGYAALLPGYVRVFRGWSTNWGGGTASLKPSDEGVVFGYLAKVSEADLRKLDRYEGVAVGRYRRERFDVLNHETGRTVGAIAYVSNSTEFNEPTRDYLKAVAKTIGAFWQGSSGPVTWQDITVR